MNTYADKVQEPKSKTSQHSSIQTQDTLVDTFAMNGQQELAGQENLQPWMKGTHNPLQMKRSTQNPLRPMVCTQNPLKPMVSNQNPLKPMTTRQNPLQLLAKQAVPGNNPLQMYAQMDGQQVPAQKRPNNTGLPDKLKEGVENLSGFSMDDVKVHYNSDKPAQLQALAYAQGTDIHLGPGQEQHLPHEAWHVVQQKQGRVQPTMQMKGDVLVNDDKGLECEADMMATKAMQLASACSFNKMSEKPLIFQNRLKGIQLKRTETGKPQYTKKAFDDPLELKEKKDAAPRVVMSFGNNAQQLIELITENKESAEKKLNPKYVIGVNVGPTDIKSSKKGAPAMSDAEIEAEKVLIIGNNMGLAVIPFTWKVGDAKDRMYEFPYFEARSLLMKEALNIGELTNSTIYAMTDRDAKDSTGIKPEYNVAKHIDIQLDSALPTLVAGPYNWRDDESKDPLLHSTIMVINSAEEEFRNWKIQNGLYTYFPEPNLFLNLAGVKKAINNFQGENFDGQQAKESEVIRKDGMQEKYNMNAWVTKPAKKPIDKKKYLEGVYTLVDSFKTHEDVTVQDVQKMFNNIIQSELSASNVREMTKNDQKAATKAQEIIENAASIINQILKIKK